MENQTIIDAIPSETSPTSNVSAGFTMAVANPNAIAAEVVAAQKIETEEERKLREQAENNATAIFNTNLSSLNDKKAIIGSIENFGVSSMEISANKNALLKTQLTKLASSGDDGGEVSRSLMELNREVKSLDPSVIDFTKKGVFGKLTNPVRNYFEKYQRADKVIAGIVDSLDKGKKTLKDDNTTLMVEQQSLKSANEQLLREVKMAQAMDDALEAKITEAKGNNVDPEQIKFVEEEILFPLRQRVMDMNQTILVNQQGIIAMEVIQRNNKELMRGVDRAKTVTVSALTTAVTIASALYNQKIVLQKIQALNETTNNMIAATSRMLREQGTEIHRQSVESNISVETLKNSFTDIFAALDEISTFKQAALPQMKATIVQFQEFADKGSQAINRLEAGNLNQAGLLTDSSGKK